MVVSRGPRHYGRTVPVIIPVITHQACKWARHASYVGTYDSGKDSKGSGRDALIGWLGASDGNVMQRITSVVDHDVMSC